MVGFWFLLFWFLILVACQFFSLYLLSGDGEDRRLGGSMGQFLGLLVNISSVYCYYILGVAANVVLIS